MGDCRGRSRRVSSQSSRGRALANCSFGPVRTSASVRRGGVFPSAPPGEACRQQPSDPFQRPTNPLNGGRLYLRARGGVPRSSRGGVPPRRSCRTPTHIRRAVSAPPPHPCNGPNSQGWRITVPPTWAGIRHSLRGGTATGVARRIAPTVEPPAVRKT